MTKENRELLARALGTIDGMYFIADEPMKTGLEHVAFLLGDILSKEESEGTE